MISKKIFSISLLILLVNACGGSEDNAEQNTIIDTPISPTVSTIDLTGVTGTNEVQETKIAGITASSRALIGNSVANAQAEIILPQENEIVQGNITFLVRASDEDDITKVSLVLSNINETITLCSEDCGVTFEQSVIGLNPYLYGETAGQVRLEIWLTDSLGNQVLANAQTLSWEPHQIDSIAATRDGQNINLSWQGHSAFNRYNVYIATQAGVSSQNIETLTNGQQFLSLSTTTLSFNDEFPEESYQVLITGVDGSGESGFSEKFSIASLGGELNFSPQAQLDQFEINEDESLQGNVLVNDVDLNMGELHLNLSALIQPQHGELVINEAGDFTYVPTPHFFGEDAFSYEVVNELGMTDIGNVVITINAQNNIPTALDNNYNITADGQLFVAAPGLLANDTDIDLDTLIVETTPFSAPERGTLILYSDGSFDYQGEVNMQGSDSFKYRIFDNQGAEAIAEVTISGVDVSISPVANNDSYNLSEGNTLTVVSSNGILNNDTHPNNESFSIDESFIITPQHGQLLLAIDGSFTYIPDANFYGVEQLQYQIIDTNGFTAKATLTLIIENEPEKPIAQNDLYSFSKNQILQVSVLNGVLLNDINMEDGDLYVNTSPLVDVQNGELILNNDGSFSYQPNLGFVGVDSFTYQISNEEGLTANAQVILSKSSFNTPPEANDDQLIVDEDSEATLFNVLTNDIDADGDSLIISAVSVDVGAVTIVNEQIQYTPPPNTNGEAVVTYTISDGDGGTDTGSLLITITSVNDAPITVVDTVTISEGDASLLIDVLANDSDIEGDSLTISSVSTDIGEVVIIDGKVQYTAPTNINGIALVTYTISDGNGGHNDGSLSITITAVNDAPIAVTDVATMNEDDAPLLIDVLANDSDIDGDDLTISTIDVDKGSVGIINNQIQYTVPANVNGIATINYTIIDGNGGSDSNTATVTIIPLNDAPIASNQSFSISQNASNDDSVGTIVASDIEHESLSYSLIGGDISLFNLNSDSGLLTVNGATPFNYATDTQHTISVGITDNGTPNETTTITVTINITVEPLIPTEDILFGRPRTGEFEFSSAFASGVFNDSVELNDNIYFVGYSNNTDKDIYISSYNINGAINTDFGDGGVKTLDLGNSEEATAIISDGSDLFIAYSSFDSTNTEVCLLKIDVNGVLDTTAGESNSGIRCTTMASTLVINDLALSTSKIHAVGKQTSSFGDDSLWIKYDASTLSFESSSPQVTDVSGNGRNDSAFAIKDFNEQGVMIVGSVISENGDKDALIRYLISDGNNESNFNSGEAFSLDLSGINKDDELYVIDGISTYDFTAFIGGYTTRSSGEQEAVVIAIDRLGQLSTDIGSSGIAIQDIDGDSGIGNGGSVITGMKYEPINNQIMLSGTTGTDDTSKLFSARMLISDGSLDTSYASSGINIISSISGTQSANALTISPDDSVWISGVNHNENSAPLIASLDNTGALFTNFSGAGYLTANTQLTDSDDESIKIIQLKSGSHASKYIIASIADNGETMKLVLTRLTEAGAIDLSFGQDGHQLTSIDVTSKSAALIEQSDGQLIIVGSQSTVSGEEGFIARFDQDGNLDTSFATEGIYDTTAITADSINLTDTAIDSNNNIITLGSSSLSDTVSSLIFRLNPDGELDTSFSHDGATTERYETVYIDSDDNIFVGGRLIDGENSDLLVMKLNATGELDSSFSLSGIYSGITSTDATDRMIKILADPSNNLYLMGNEFGTPNEAVVIKLSSAGELDSSFGVGGVAHYSLAISGNTKIHDAALDSAGKIVITGIANEKGMLARVSNDGTLDNTFGLGELGYYEAEQCENKQTFTSLILQSDTQVVISSTCFDGNSNNVSASKFNFYENGVEP